MYTLSKVHRPNYLRNTGMYAIHAHVHSNRQLYHVDLDCFVVMQLQRRIYYAWTKRVRGFPKRTRRRRRNTETMYTLWESCHTYRNTVTNESGDSEMCTSHDILCASHVKHGETYPKIFSNSSIVQRHMDEMISKSKDMFRFSHYVMCIFGNHLTHISKHHEIAVYCHSIVFRRIRQSSPQYAWVTQVSDWYFQIIVSIIAMLVYSIEAIGELRFETSDLEVSVTQIINQDNAGFNRTERAVDANVTSHRQEHLDNCSHPAVSSDPRIKPVFCFHRWEYKNTAMTETRN